MFVFVIVLACAAADSIDEVVEVEVVDDGRDVVDDAAEDDDANAVEAALGSSAPTRGVARVTSPPPPSPPPAWLDPLLVGGASAGAGALSLFAGIALLFSGNPLGPALIIAVPVAMGAAGGFTAWIVGVDVVAVVAGDIVGVVLGAAAGFVAGSISGNALDKQQGCADCLSFWAQTLGAVGVVSGATVGGVIGSVVGAVHE